MKACAIIVLVAADGPWSSNLLYFFVVLKLFLAGIESTYRFVNCKLVSPNFAPPVAMQKQELWLSLPHNYTRRHIRLWVFVAGA
jgi:hypothetical protein